MNTHSAEEPHSTGVPNKFAGRHRSISITCAEDRGEHGTTSNRMAAATTGSLTSWRQTFSAPSNNAIGPSASLTPTAGMTSTASPQARLRPSSRPHRRASHPLWGGVPAVRSGATTVGSAGSNTAAANTNVYTLQLPGDDGGVEMAAAQPLLLGALRMRETYKNIDKGQCEVTSLGSCTPSIAAGAAAVPLEASRNTQSVQGTQSLVQLGSQQQQQQQQMHSPLPVAWPTTLQQVDGVFYWSEEKTPIASWGQFHSDVLALAACVQHPSCVAASKYRLLVLEEKYHLHRLYNADVEENSDRYRRGGGLFANACRVDNCVGVSTAMNAQWLVEYIHRTIDEHGDDVVAVSDTTPRGSLVSTIGTGGNAMETSGGEVTLTRVCELLDFPDPYLLTVEGLGLQPSVSRALPYYNALDASLNGSGRNSAALLRLFLSIGQSPQLGGAYLAGAVQQCLQQNELRTSGPQATEMVLEITGTVPQEWENTASWVRTHELDSFGSNQFQVAFPVTKWCSHSGRDGRKSFFGAHAGGPDGDETCNSHPTNNQDMAGARRATSSSMGQGNAASFAASAPISGSEEVLAYDNYQQLLDSIFLPLFTATLTPEDPKYVDLAMLLQHTGAILLTGSENAELMGNTSAGTETGHNPSGTKSGSLPTGDAPGLHGDTMNTVQHRRPADTPYTEPVSVTYLCYYIWANLCSLNALRRRRGLNVLQLRVVASRATMPNTSSAHNASLLLLSYLIADVVVDAVALDRQPVLQYLYGIDQIGVAMCPVARSSLGTTTLDEHPVARLLWRGLCVSLCTLDPLYYHSSQEPLLEEYTVAAKVHRLSPTDISEMALHSVCMSSFDDEVKGAWIGTGLLYEGWRANSMELTSVPTARLQMRCESWAAERKLLILPSSPLTNGTGAPGNQPADFCPPTEDTQNGTRRDGAAVSARLGTGTLSHLSLATTSTPVGQAGAAIGAPPMQAPYTVLDTAFDFPRAVLIGPFDRDIQNARLVQALHHALELRHQYSSLPLPPQVSPSAAANGGDNVRSSDVKAGWLAALIHDPQAVLPHPTQSMSWAFKKKMSSHEKEMGGGRASGGSGTASSAAPGVNSYLLFDENEWKYKTVEGIIVPHEVHQIPRLPQDLYRYTDFCNHVEEIRNLIDNISVRDFALRRLQLLEHRFKLHTAVNHSRELCSTAARASHNRNFYQSTKVDNNIRMETGMTARQLLAFIVDKAMHNGDDIVSHPKGKEPQTLRQLLSELQIKADSLAVDDLNVEAGATSSDGGAPHNPFSSEEQPQNELLTLLLKTDNQMNGRYFAELTKRTFEELSRDQHTFTESRLPVYGASSEEWALLSHWFDTHGMHCSHNQWVVQVPRIYSSLRRAGRVSCFAEYLEHIFEPLWRISLHPNSDPRLFHFINHIAAFDCVEDERRPDMPQHLAMRSPHEWTTDEEPPYNYYLYHLYANLRSLNHFRQRRRFSIFSFRPSCGEAGCVDHLIGGFLLAQGINYGVRLADSAPLQYLFYLAQIGVTMSPLSNNTKLQLNYLHNPFPEFFRRGLRVSLGTDSPLLYHHTQEPLLEEYSIASKIWKLSPSDLSEVARNSVLVSNFSAKFKEEKLGSLYFLSSSAGNDIAKTHLSNVRIAYRFEAYHTEVGFLEYISGQHFHRALLTLAMEAQCKAICAATVGSGGELSAGERDDGVKTTLAAYGGAARKGSNGSAHSNMVGLIDTTTKESDLVQLEAQRTRMQRQLWDLTTSVADLHRQNRLLTAKLAEEKERDQLAAQMRRQRVDDRLRELEGLMTQKQVQRHTGDASETSLQQQQSLEERGIEPVHTSGNSSTFEPHSLARPIAVSSQPSLAAVSPSPAAPSPATTTQAEPPQARRSSELLFTSHDRRQQQSDAVAQTHRLLPPLRVSDTSTVQSMVSPLPPPK